MIEGDKAVHVPFRSWKIAKVCNTATDIFAYFLIRHGQLNNLSTRKITIHYIGIPNRQKESNQGVFKNTKSEGPSPGTVLFVYTARKQ